MAIDHAAQSAKVKETMRNTGYEVVYNSGGPMASSAKHDAFESNSHMLNAAREGQRVSDALGDMSGKRIDYAGGIRRV